MSTIPLSVLELLKCEFEPNALHREFPAQPNNYGPSYIFVRQTANLPTEPAIGLRHASLNTITQQKKPAHVRFGSKADICSAVGHVRFTPESRHVRCK